MIGGFGQQEVTEDHINIINTNTAAINTKLGINAASFTINQVSSQVVAGVNYHFHLTADNAEKYTVRIFVPL